MTFLFRVFCFSLVFYFSHFFVVCILFQFLHIFSPFSSFLFSNRTFYEFLLAPVFEPFPLNFRVFSISDCHNHFSPPSPSSEMSVVFASLHFGFSQPRDSCLLVIRHQNAAHSWVFSRDGNMYAQVGVENIRQARRLRTNSPIILLRKLQTTLFRIVKKLVICFETKSANKIFSETSIKQKFLCVQQISNCCYFLRANAWSSAIITLL